MYPKVLSLTYATKDWSTDETYLFHDKFMDHYKLIQIVYSIMAQNTSKTNKELAHTVYKTNVA